MKYIQRIRDLREDHDLTQQTVAEVLGTTQQYYGRYELGQKEMPIYRLVELCRYYNVSADYLLGFTDKMKELPKDGNPFD